MLNTKNMHILIVEDNVSSALVYRSYIESDYQVTEVYNGKDALQKLKETPFSLLLVDINLPDMTGLEVLDAARQMHAQIPVIIITSQSSVDVVVDAMRHGASDFLSKPFDKARLLVTIKNCLKESQLTAIVREYEKTFVRDRFHAMLGSSLPMQTVYRIIESAASSRATVFITGESGTGKELCAEAIHKESARSDKPYIALNCAAIPRDLIESEIFGHVKGAFTGASSSRQGAATLADGGTLFLDEIGEMPLDLQSKLLRFIQSGTFQPVGGSKEYKVDVRFICATNRDPLKEVEEGRFREDLYYRLHVIPIHMPALRERAQDCLLIAKRFLEDYSQDEEKQFQGFMPDVERFFLNYPWPGNVRELSNVVRNIVVLNQGEKVAMSMLPAQILNNATDPSSEKKVIAKGIDDKPVVVAEENADLQNATTNSDSYLQNEKQNSVMTEKDIRPLWIEEKEIIERAINACKGNVPKAAAFLDISASTIYRKKQQWEAV